MRPKGSQGRQTMNKVEKMDVDEPILVDSDARNGGHQDVNPEVHHQSFDNNRKKKNRRNKKSASKAAAAAAYPNIDVIDLTTDEDVKADSLLADDPLALEIELDEEADMPELIDVEPIPADVLAESWKQKGNAHFALGEYHHALEMYTKAIEIFASEAAYYGNRSACYLMLKKYKEALVDARAAVQIDSNFEKGHLRLLRATLSLGDVAACEAAVKAISDNSSFTMHIQPEISKLTLLKQNLKEITIARARKDYRKVLYLCERTMDIANGNMQLKMWKADALSMLERYSEAQDVCTDALQSDSKSVEAIYMYSVCLYQADNLEKAVQFLRQSLQLAPDNTECLSLYRKLKQLKELREQASTRFSSGQYVEARLNYSECLEVMKNVGLKNNTIESKLHFNLSLIAHKKGDVDSSLESCKIAIDKNPNYLKAILHQAKLHSAKEMFEETVRDYEAALKIDPKLKDVRRYLQDAKLSAKKAKRKDYYKILNIDKQASEDEIRKAYKKRALVHHPDRHASATETVRKENERLFKEVGEAYEVLSDPKKKVRYDQGHDLIDSPSADSYDSFDPNTLFNVFFSQGGMGMGGGGGGAPRGGFHHFRSAPNYGGFNR